MIDLNDRAYSLYLGLLGLDYDEAGCRASIVAAMETLLRDAAAAIDTSDPGQFPDPGTRRREDREAKLRERASEIDADAHDNYCGTTCPPDDSHDAPLFIKRVLDALRQTEEEALQRGKEHAEQMHAALGGKSPASSPEND